jgi:hypothetical protein
VVKAELSSSDWFSARTKELVTRVNSSRSMSVGDSSCADRPPVDPKPGIDAGGTGMIVASLILANSTISRLATKKTMPSLPGRSSQGTRASTAMPVFEPWPKKFWPRMTTAPSISGTSATMSSILLRTASVRPSEAPLGSCTLTNRTP